MIDWSQCPAVERIPGKVGDIVFEAGDTLLVEAGREFAHRHRYDRAFLLVGVGPLRSAKAAEWMRTHVPGLHIPDEVIRRLAGAQDPAREGLQRTPHRVVNAMRFLTHGYGLTLGPVNEVTQEGLPVLFIKNLPPESTVDLKVTEPSLYYGEISNDHVFVKTNTREFHYPKGEDNVYAVYEGSGGVPVNTYELVSSP